MNAKQSYFWRFKSRFFARYTSTPPCYEVSFTLTSRRVKMLFLVAENPWNVENSRLKIFWQSRVTRPFWIILGAQDRYIFVINSRARARTTTNYQQAISSSRVATGTNGAFLASLNAMVPTNANSVNTSLTSRVSEPNRLLLRLCLQRPDD